MADGMFPTDPEGTSRSELQKSVKSLDKSMHETDEAVA